MLILVSFMWSIPNFCFDGVGNALRPGQILRDGDAEVLETFYNVDLLV